MPKDVKKMNRNEWEAAINLKAWKDSSFKKKLLSNPKDALSEFGFPEGVDPKTFKIVEENTSQNYIVLHKAPEKIEALSEQELNALAGGGNRTFNQELACCGNNTSSQYGGEPTWS